MYNNKFVNQEELEAEEAKWNEEQRAENKGYTNTDSSDSVDPQNKNGIPFREDVDYSNQARNGIKASSYPYKRDVKLAGVSSSTFRSVKGIVQQQISSSGDTGRGISKTTTYIRPVFAVTKTAATMLLSAELQLNAQYKLKQAGYTGNIGKDLVKINKDLKELGYKPIDEKIIRLKQKRFKNIKFRQTDIKARMASKAMRSAKFHNKKTLNPNARISADVIRKYKLLHEAYRAGDVSVRGRIGAVKRNSLSLSRMAEMAIITNIGQTEAGKGISTVSRVGHAGESVVSNSIRFGIKSYRVGSIISKKIHLDYLAKEVGTRVTSGAITTVKTVATPGMYVASRVYNTKPIKVARKGTATIANATVQFSKASFSKAKYGASSFKKGFKRGVDKTADSLNKIKIVRNANKGVRFTGRKIKATSDWTRKILNKLLSPIRFISGALKSAYIKVAAVLGAIILAFTIVIICISIIPMIGSTLFSWFFQDVDWRQRCANELQKCYQEDMQAMFDICTMDEYGNSYDAVYIRYIDIKDEDSYSEQITEDMNKYKDELSDKIKESSFADSTDIEGISEDYISDDDFVVNNNGPEIFSVVLTEAGGEIDSVESVKRVRELYQRTHQMDVEVYYWYDTTKPVGEGCETHRIAVVNYTSYYYGEVFEKAKETGNAKSSISQISYNMTYTDDMIKNHGWKDFYKPVYEGLEVSLWSYLKEKGLSNDIATCLMAVMQYNSCLEDGAAKWTHILYNPQAQVNIKDEDGNITDYTFGLFGFDKEETEKYQEWLSEKQSVNYDYAYTHWKPQIDYALSIWIPECFKENTGRTPARVSGDYLWYPTIYVEDETTFEQVKASEDDLEDKLDTFRRVLLTKWSNQDGVKKSLNSYIKTYEDSQLYTFATDKTIGKKMGDIAKTVVGKRFELGGNTTDGFDSPGYIEYIASSAGFFLPHSSYDIRGFGNTWYDIKGYRKSMENINKDNEEITFDIFSFLEYGDILCYDGKVSIYIGNGNELICDKAWGSVHLNSVDVDNLVMARRYNSYN